MILGGNYDNLIEKVTHYWGKNLRFSDPGFELGFLGTSDVTLRAFSKPESVMVEGMSLRKIKIAGLTSYLTQPKLIPCLLNTARGKQIFRWNKLIRHD